jgi:exonuclease SbcC
VSRSCKFIKDAVVDRECIGKLQGQLSKAKEPNPDEAAFAKELTMLRDRTAGKQDIEKKESTVRTLKSSSVKQADQLEKDLTAIREDLKLLPKAEEAEKALPGLEAELATILKEGKEVIRELEEQEKLLATEIESLRGDLSKLKADDTLEGRIRKQKETIASASMVLDSLRKEDSSLRVSLGALTEGLKLIGAAREQLAKVAADIEALDREISEWKIIEKAMEGIITLEIDDAGPTVTAITNDILHTCYGPRFSVNIKTQDSKVKGDDMKEVFDIIVYDSERDESKSLSVMSGGEETWIQDAVTRGISLFNASRKGGKYQSLFSDEKDGRLTEKRRKEFMAVKRKVLEIGGFFCEYFISHTKEIQDMADDVLNLDDFASDQGLRAAAPGMKQETLA